MAFISCEELFGDRPGTPFDSTGKTTRSRRTYKRRFRVVVDSNEYDALSVCTHPNLPSPWAPYITTYSYDLQAYLVKMSAKEEYSDDWQNWIVECDYDTDTGTGGPEDGTLEQGSPFPGAGNSSLTGGSGSVGGRPGGSANNPEEEAPQIEWDSEVSQYSPQEDLEGSLYHNEAAQAFSPPPVFDRGFLTLTITRNQTRFDHHAAIEYAFAVNNAEFIGFPPGAVQCYPVKATRQFKGSNSFYRTTTKLRFRRKRIDTGEYDSWQPHILNAGLMQRENDPLKARFMQPVPIPNGFGGFITTPVLLDNGGQELPEGSDPVWLDFVEFPEKDFSIILNRGIGA